MKRVAVKTERNYAGAGRYFHHGGPVQHIARNDTCSFTVRQNVRVRRYNAIVLRRKLRLASFVDAPILRKKQCENTQSSIS